MGIPEDKFYPIWRGNAHKHCVGKMVGRKWVVFVYKKYGSGFIFTGTQKFPTKDKAIAFVNTEI